MNASEAREHLDMVDRILSRVDEPCTLSPYPFLIWGVAGAILNVLVQLVFMQHATQWLLALFVPVLIVAIGLMIWWAMGMRAVEQQGALIHRYIFSVFNLAWIVALVIQIGAERIFPTWAQAALYLLMYGFAMVSVGLISRNRPILLGGAVMLGSIVVANFTLLYAGYVLALGDLIGMAGAGIALWLQRN
jgi:hypothetical protein